eukprot:3711372-Ditylum_brightwellii.AAC.1
MAVGLQSGGHENFWGSVFNKLCADVLPRMKQYFVQKYISTKKRRKKQREAEEKRRCAKKQLDKMYDENRKVIKGAAANKTN